MKVTHQIPRQKSLLHKSIISAVILLLIITVVITCIGFINRKPTAAYYRLSEKEQAALTSMLNQNDTKGHSAQRFAVRVLDPDKPLTAQIHFGGPSVIFTHTGKNAETAALIAEKRKTVLPAGTMGGYTVSMRKTAVLQSDGSIAALPVAADHFEISLNKTLLDQTGTVRLISWNDFTSYLMRAHETKGAQAVFAGGDDDMLLGITGALAESLSGKEALDKTLSIAAEMGMKHKTDFSALARKTCASPDAPLYPAVRLIASWYHAGLLRQDVISLVPNDIRTLMSSETISASFMTLSFHREIPFDTITRYTTIFYLPGHPAETRNFTAPVISAILLSRDNTVKKAVMALASVPAQEQFSRASGLAPAQANCTTPDMQANDVRYWLASTDTPQPQLGDLLCTNTADRHAFAAELRLIITQLQ